MAKVYMGKECSIHPELDGRRYPSGRCTGCASLTTKNKMQARRDEMRALRATVSDKDFQRLRNYQGTVCVDHADSEGWRDYVTKKCVHCVREKRAMRKAVKRNQEKFGGGGPVGAPAEITALDVMPDLKFMKKGAKDDRDTIFLKKEFK